MIQQTLMHPIKNGRFKFACHPGLSCFTRCCARLDLVLTPYDIIRLKNRLGLSSQAFLKRYTAAYVSERCGAPLVQLRMSEEEKRRCPFVSPQGCRIYGDRPGACRMYPVGRAASKIAGMAEAGEYYFLIKESHCRGFEEEREWSLADWLQDQGLEEYNQMNDLFLDITAGIQPARIKALGEQQLGMFYMACYDLDRFRDFIFATTFLERFDLNQETIEGLQSDDIELMKFSCRWLRFALFGDKTITLKTPGP